MLLLDAKCEEVLRKPLPAPPPLVIDDVTNQGDRFIIDGYSTIRDSYGISYGIDGDASSRYSSPNRYEHKHLAMFIYGFVIYSIFRVVDEKLLSGGTTISFCRAWKHRSWYFRYSVLLLLLISSYILFSDEICDLNMERMLSDLQGHGAHYTIIMFS